MTSKEFTCIVCPNGCSIHVALSGDDALSVSGIEGGLCLKGRAWVRQELENPMRTISSSVPIVDGDYRLASVRTNRPVPLAKVRAVVAEIHKLALVAPVRIGDVVVSCPAGCDTDIIVTRNVRKVDCKETTL